MRDPKHNGIDDSIKDEAYATAVRQERAEMSKTYYDARHNLFYVLQVIDDLQDEIYATTKKYDERLTPETVAAYDEVIELLDQAREHMGSAVDSHDTPTKYVFEEDVTP
jgi:beta-phosphoglucomutase-like phosphatase (HAD superfamily)